MKNLPNPRKILIVIGIMFLVVGFFVIINFLSVRPDDVPEHVYPTGTAIFSDGTEITLEVADTQETQMLGLGQRDTLAKNSGMLFSYLVPNDLSFWMKGMRFPIDIIWLKDGEIISISKNIPIETAPFTVYKPDGLSDQVIEVNAGFSDKHGLSSGNQVDIIVKNR